MTPEPRDPGRALDDRRDPGRALEEGDPARSLEEALRNMVERSRRVLWLVVFTQGAVLVLAVLAIVVLAFALVRQQTRIGSDETAVRSAECDTHYSIGTANPSQQTTKVGVSIIEAERKAFVVLRCPGRLGPPGKELVQLARRYGIPLRY